MTIFEWNKISYSWSLHLPRRMPGYVRTAKRNWQTTSTSLLQAAQYSVHTEAIIYQIQIWWWCILFTQGHGNKNSYAESLILENQSECCTHRRSVATQSRCLGQWETRGKQRSEPATGNASWLGNDPHSWAWTPLHQVEFEINLVYQIRNYQAASSLQASYVREIVRSYETSTTEPSWRSHSTTVEKDYRGMWKLSNFHRLSTTLSSLATAIGYCFQPWSGARPDVYWKEGSATRY